MVSFAPLISSFTWKAEAMLSTLTVWFSNSTEQSSTSLPLFSKLLLKKAGEKKNPLLSEKTQIFCKIPFTVQVLMFK